ncbi:MAG: hypothetical protein H7Z75_07025 [Ferruginibacter sp.]|nr:hypothetical protein [Cytophagales bacterium]
MKKRVWLLVPLACQKENLLEHPNTRARLGALTNKAPGGEDECPPNTTC